MPYRDVVCVIENNAQERDNLNRVLSRSGYLVKDYDSGIAFMQELAWVHASCAVIDARMPDVDLFTLVSELSRNRLDIPYIICADAEHVPQAVAAMRLGAVDFIEKPVDGEKLLQLLRQAIENRGAGTAADPRPFGNALVERLTPRERDVLNLLLEGYQNKTIAYELGISQRTVEVYRARVMRRLEVGSFAELVRLAIEHHYPGRAEMSARSPHG